MTNNPVLITWRDAYETQGHGAWVDDKELKGLLTEDCICEIVGWIVERGKKFTTIAGMRSDDGSYGHLHRIPNRDVLRTKRL